MVPRPPATRPAASRLRGGGSGRGCEHLVRREGTGPRFILEPTRRPRSRQRQRYPPRSQSLASTVRLRTRRGECSHSMRSDTVSARRTGRVPWRLEEAAWGIAALQPVPPDLEHTSVGLPEPQRAAAPAPHRPGMTCSFKVVLLCRMRIPALLPRTATPRCRFALTVLPSRHYNARCVQS